MAAPDVIPNHPDNRRIQFWLMGLLPLVALIGVIAVFLVTDPVSIFSGDVPPVEVLESQRLLLDNEGFRLDVLNSGPDPISIAQVQVDGAYWKYRFEAGDPVLDRFESASIRIPYPWVEGEAHEIVVITTTGVAFPFAVDVALATPVPSARQFRAYGLLGVYVGVLPVTLGLLWYPFLRRLRREWMNFALALTVGLLVFLAIDTFEGALELAAEVPAIFQGESLVFLLVPISLLAIKLVSDIFRSGDSRLLLAYTIALGIGFHNLGEGLAVGAAFAIGQVSLGTFLVIGFTLHNITEGIGIAAPITTKRPPLYHFVALALLAGGPAVLGVWIGGFSFNPLLAVVFLSIGIGAILQVVYEVARLLIQDSRRHEESALNTVNSLGFLIGVAIMYFTAFLVV